MHDDQERLTEALSAYLDDALDSAERDALERHLATCETCRAELAGLRRVGALLRALPEPALPRSFTLPVTTTGAGRPEAARRAVGWARAAQWAGGLAATLGVGLLMAGVIQPQAASYSGAAASQYPFSRGGATSATGAGGPFHTPSLDQSTGTVVTPPSYGPGSPPAPVGTGSVSTPTPMPTTGLKNQSAESPLIPTGATLLVGGGAALAAGTVSRRRARKGAGRAS